MPETSRKLQLGELLGQAHVTMPRARFWFMIARGVGIGLVGAAPIVGLLLFHEGPSTGFLWDVLFRLPFLLVVIALLAKTVKYLRQGGFKEGMKGLLALVFFGSLTTLAWFELIQHVHSLIHFHRMQPGHALEVRVGCHATDDPVAVRLILSDLRKAEWYSPDSHGWSAYADLTLRFADGHSEYYSLTEVLAEGRLVVRWPGNNGVLVAVPNLANSMQQAGLLRVASYPRFDNKGYYEAIVPPSVCKPEKAREN